MPSWPTGWCGGQHIASTGGWGVVRRIRSRPIGPRCWRAAGAAETGWRSTPAAAGSLRAPGRQRLLGAPVRGRAPDRGPRRPGPGPGVLRGPAGRRPRPDVGQAPDDLRSGASAWPRRLLRRSARRPGPPAQQAEVESRGPRRLRHRARHRRGGAPDGHPDHDRAAAT